MKSCLTLFIGFKASSRHLRAEFLDTDIPLNPIGHLRKRIKSLCFLLIHMAQCYTRRAFKPMIFCSSFFEGIFIQKRFCQTESQQTFYSYCTFALSPAPKSTPILLISPSRCNYKYLHNFTYSYTGL